MFRLTLTLADGTVFTHDVKRMPRHYASWLMQRCPYGTTFQGCSFKRERI